MKKVKPPKKQITSKQLMDKIIDLQKQIDELKNENNKDVTMSGDDYIKKYGITSLRFIPLP